jgi:hypothetical protein
MMSIPGVGADLIDTVTGAASAASGIDNLIGNGSPDNWRDYLPWEGKPYNNPDSDLPPSWLTPHRDPPSVVSDPSGNFSGHGLPSNWQNYLPHQASPVLPSPPDFYTPPDFLHHYGVVDYPAPTPSVVDHPVPSSSGFSHAIHLSDNLYRRIEKSWEKRNKRLKQRSNKKSMPWRRNLSH